MKISDYTVDLFSERTAVEKTVKRESLRTWGDKDKQPLVEKRLKDNPSVVTKNINSTSVGQIQTDDVQLSSVAMQGRPRRALVAPVPEGHKIMADLNLEILKEMIERITGKIMDFRIPGEVGASGPVETNEAPADELSPVVGQGFGMEYDYYESHYEYESTSFESSGTIQTEDGQEIGFNVRLNMSREFMTEHHVNIMVGEPLKDPLVVNFGGGAAEIHNRDFEFDIDADGKNDQIGFVGPNSGYLVLDKNENGIVDNGLELFGPQTGRGFSELAAYDADGNNWIDENDSIYNRLRIWTKDESGNDQLFALGEKGVGAIYLHHIETPFFLKGEGNSLLGQVRESSVYLGDDGSVGTVQQIDLAV
ncbi:hypothetical protein [Desulfopila sp. IMCC35008]|uniref:hypothetical protein n=1 Tax=Desulfopila sp. IMCC35008 TaxID=2653858 RepID=UPI0013D5B49B|nr:hypothetical protein [Desulfopila sp. IMCC35008]